KANTDIQDVRPRPACRFSLAINHENWQSFNRLSVWVYPKSQGFINFYFHAAITNKENQNIVHAPSLIPNQWNHVFFEFPDFVREDIIGISMGPLLMGCPPEANPEVAFYFSNIVLEQVSPDYDFGWDLEERIAYCHSGYFLDAEKKALVAASQASSFKLLNEQNEIVFSQPGRLIDNEYGQFWEFDFSTVQKPGLYKIQTGNKETALFPISSFPYREALWKSVHFLKSLRCGCEIKGVHSACHLTHHTIHPLDGRLIGDWGGWHDAGDVSQFAICTAEIVHALLDCAEKLGQHDEELSEMLLDEARHGANWLLKTHFGDGYRSLAVLYSIWTSNQIKSADLLKMETPTTIKNVAENGPFENFLASAALSACAKMFQKRDDIFAHYCLRIAKADFAFGVEGLKKGLFTRRWGRGPLAQVSGALVLAASQLYELTKDEKYLDVAVLSAQEVMDCQEVNLPNWQKPLRGFFYEDSDHKHYLSYEHRGHEQSPITGIIKLMAVAPHHPQFSKWKQTVTLYQEYIEKTKDFILPYGLLPAHIYEKDKINLDRFTLPNRDLLDSYLRQLHEQIETGIALDDEVFLRRFPIAIQRRGFHATLLSKTKAVSAISQSLNSARMRQVAINQVEWILGKNPFATSTMYGEGYNYHPLYVAFSQQLLGALPVGIKTKGSADVPYWPLVNNAVYKEVWGHTTAKFLWVLADLLL
ncbi:MAG TPA: glycoside hydrolase family 9 protein, partial [Bacilli bacterium]|nr:glycoside hydrolase family 9 protein [Bacilli bacterium]